MDCEPVPMKRTEPPGTVSSMSRLDVAADRHRRSLSAVTALVVGLGALGCGCRPTAEGSPMTVRVVAVSANDFRIDVEICEGSGIGGFDVHWRGGAMETRWVDNSPRYARTISLDLSRDSFKRQSWNRAEVTQVSRSGDLPDGMSGVDIFLTTGNGFAQWKMSDLPRSRSKVWTVTGRGRPEAVASEAAGRLDGACSA